MIVLCYLTGVRISSLQKGREKGRQDTLEGFLQQPSSSSHHEATASSFELQTSNREVAPQVINVKFFSLLLAHNIRHKLERGLLASFPGRPCTRPRNEAREVAR